MEFSTKIMHSAFTTLYLLQMKKDEKDLGKESEATPSIYGFLEENWLKSLLEKPIKKEGVDINKEEPEEKRNEEGGKKEGN